MRGADSEMACRVIEQPSQDRGGVEAGQAQPVHRPGVGHQRRGAAVGQQRMPTDRDITHGFLLTRDRKIGAPFAADRAWGNAGYLR